MDCSRDQDRRRSARASHDVRSLRRGKLVATGPLDGAEFVRTLRASVATRLAKLLPDAPALDAPIRQARVGLLDLGVCPATDEALTGGQTVGDFGPPTSHGTAMAVTIHAVAPAAIIVSANARVDPAGCLRRLRDADVDFVVAAIGCRSSQSLEQEIQSWGLRILTTWRPGHDALLPAATPGVSRVAEWSGWPRGPFVLPTHAAAWGGMSCATAFAAGAASLLVAAGIPVLEAMHLVTAVPQE